MGCVATKPRGGEHKLIGIDSRRAPHLAPEAAVVTRWCCLCGGVVVDLDMDGRTLPGEIAAMQFPALAIQAAAPAAKEQS